jgi:hypothetical protein
MVNLQEQFRDDSFEDVSKREKYTDIKAVPKGSDHCILLEIKNWEEKSRTRLAWTHSFLLSN